jgi:hypothetical protein
MTRFSWLLSLLPSSTKTVLWKRLLQLLSVPFLLAIYDVSYSCLIPARACVRQIAKMWWIVLRHPADSPCLALSDYRLFGPVKDALCGCHFEYDNEFKLNFRYASRSSGRNFIILVYSVLLNAGKGSPRRRSIIITAASDYASLT